MKSLTVHYIGQVFQRLMHLGDVIQPLNAMIFGPHFYEVVLEISSVVWLTSFWGTMCLWNFLFKAQDNISGSNAGQRFCFQLPSGSFYHCKHVVLSLVECFGVWYNQSARPSHTYISDNSLRYRIPFSIGVHLPGWHIESSFMDIFASHYMGFSSRG